MFGKNVIQDKAQRFSIKKYSIGVVSVLLGLAFLGGTVVQADESTNVQVESATSQLVQSFDSTIAQDSTAPLEVVQVESQVPENNVTPDAIAESISPAIASETLAVVEPVAEVEDAQLSVIGVEEYQKKTANKQEVTVEGYITGSLKSGTAYGDEYSNLALGATKEADAKDTIPVQLVSKSDVRKAYNVKDNPQYIGKKARVTGISDIYFKKIGIKSTSKIEIIEEVETPLNTKPVETPLPPVEPVNPNVTPIDHLRIAEQGKDYIFAGKVISPINAWGGQGFYVQDNSGAGIYVYPKKDLSLNQGDVVELSGTLSKYGSELQIVDITSSKKITSDINTPISTLKISGLSADK